MVADIYNYSESKCKLRFFIDIEEMPLIVLRTSCFMEELYSQKLAHQSCMEFGRIPGYGLLNFYLIRT